MPEETPVPTPEAPRREPAVVSVESGASGVFEQKTETISEKVGEKYQHILSKVKTVVTPPHPPAVASDADALDTTTDAETVVAKLVVLAEVKGIPHAVAVAQKMNDYFLLDRMHDELADKFYEALKAKGLVD